MSQFKPAVDYLPHELPMVMVETVLDVGREHAECEATVSKQGVLAPFINQNDAIPAWFAIEMMAQTIGVWCGWHAVQHGGKPRLGLLLGSRAFKSAVSEFPCGGKLKTSVHLLLRDEKLANFDCRVELDGNTVITAKLNVYEPDDKEIVRLIQRGSKI